MAGNLWAGNYGEMEDIVTGPVDNKPTFRGLKQYVKDLDSNTLPPFLSRVCAPDKTSSYSDEEILCIFETAAEVHGRSIVPHIGHIIARVIRVMESVSWSLHSTSCSNLVCKLSRYCIDPLATEEVKSEILSSLCRPLSDCLMKSNESVSSGSALCVASLVQSNNNWEFASNELVNDVCLKVSGALEEPHCRTDAHLGLVVALSKHNHLKLEPYGRSLIRSGLQILDASSTKARNFQLIMSSIEMIHCIMKSFDVRIISSEIGSIIHVLEQCQDDTVPDVHAAAVQAAETAKILWRQEEYRHQKKIGLFENSSEGNSRKGSNSPIDDVDIRDSSSSGSSCGLQAVRSIAGFDSQASVGQCMSNLESTRARRRLWSTGSHSSHEMPNYEFFHTAALDSDDALGVRGHSNSAGLLKPSRRWSGVSRRIGDPCPTCLTPQATDSQFSGRQALSSDIRMQSTPRKQLHCFSSCRDSERYDHQFSASPAFRQTRCSGHCSDHLLFEKNNDEIEERNGYCDSVQQDNQCNVQNTGLLTEGLKFPTNSGHSDSAQTQCENRQAEHEKMTRSKKGKGKCFRCPFFLFFCAAVIVALLLAWWKPDRNELYVVPT